MHLFHTQAGDCVLVVRLPWYSSDTRPGHIQTQLLFNDQMTTQISHAHTQPSSYCLHTIIHQYDDDRLTAFDPGQPG